MTSALFGLDVRLLKKFILEKEKSHWVRLAPACFLDFLGTSPV